MASVASSQLDEHPEVELEDEAGRQRRVVTAGTALLPLWKLGAPSTVVLRRAADSWNQIQWCYFPTQFPLENAQERRDTTRGYGSHIVVQL